MVRPDQVVGGGFAGGIGGVGRIGRIFRKRRVVGFQAAIHFVCGNVVEPVPRLGIFVQPDIFDRLEQGVGAHDIGFNEGIRALDGAVHVGFSGKMDNGVDVAGGKQGFHQGLVQDVAVDKFKVGAGFGLPQIVSVAGISERIQGNDGVGWMVFEPVVDEVGADEAGGAGNE